jgi:hypothetical protein
MGFFDLFKSDSEEQPKSQKSAKKKRKEKEWKDPNEQEKYVCEAGKVMCVYCNPPIGGFVVTSNTVSLQDRYYVTDGDNNGKVNLDFKGVCMHPSQQKSFAPPPPCKTVISTTKWKNCADTYVNEHYALLVKSTIPCMICQQDIKIIHSGQKAVLDKVLPTSNVLVTAIKGEKEAFPNEKIIYQVTSYNKTAKESDKKQVRWTIDIDGKQENLSVCGEKAEIEMKEKWAGKEIVVIAYLNTSTKKASQKTKVQPYLIVCTKAGKELFYLDGTDQKKWRNNSVWGKQSVQEIYNNYAYQWFEPKANNYLPLLKVYPNIRTFIELKHFSWDDIAIFAEKDRWMIQYRSHGAGDWKYVKDGADQYILVTVDGIPYWADAIGQIPFAVDCFTDYLADTKDYKKAQENTINEAQKHSAGQIIGGSIDASNSYDNLMVKRAINWAIKRYEITKEGKLKKTDFSPQELSKASDGTVIK